MKKYIICFVIFSSFCLNALAEIKAPEWSDFCPEEYLKVKRDDLGKNESYWYARRIQFKSEMNACKDLEGRELKSCYDDVISKEEEKNSKWGSMSNAVGEALERGRENSQVYSQDYNPMMYGVTGLINSIQQMQY